METQIIEKANYQYILATMPASLKNQLRALKRFIDKPDIPAAIKRVKRSQIKSIEKKLLANSESVKEANTTLKYKKFRFRDRIKLTKLIKKTRSQLALESVS